MLWPLFARAPRHGFLENFLLSARVCKVFFFCCAPLGASAGPEQKKNTTQGVFFFCSGPGERQGKEKPRWAPARGQSKKKNTTQGVFFLLRPWAPARGQSKKKKHHPGCFFLLWPLFARAPRHGFLENFLLSARVCKVFFFLRSVGRLGGARAKKKTPPRVFFFAPAPGKGRGRRSPVGRRHGARAKKKNTTQGVFFLLRPWAPARGQSKKKNTTQGVFFLLRPRGKAGEGEVRWAPRRGQSKKKNTTQGVFFFAPAPGKGRGRRSPVGRRHGARAKKKTTLTHSLWAGAISARFGWCFFFLLWPRRVFFG